MLLRSCFLRSRAGKRLNALLDSGDCFFYLGIARSFGMEYVNAALAINRDQNAVGPADDYSLKIAVLLRILEKHRFVEKLDGWWHNLFLSSSFDELIERNTTRLFRLEETANQ